jgi:hypothetical protein
VRTTNEATTRKHDELVSFFIQTAKVGGTKEMKRPLFGNIVAWSDSQTVHTISIDAWSDSQTVHAISIDAWSDSQTVHNKAGRDQRVHYYNSINGR